MIVLHAFIQVKPEFREQFVLQAAEIIKGSQAEAGCISYDLYENAGRPNSFVMLEEWKDEEALQFHNQAPHFIAFKEATKDMVAEPTKAKLFQVAE